MPLIKCTMRGPQKPARPILSRARASLPHISATHTVSLQCTRSPAQTTRSGPLIRPWPYAQRPFFSSSRVIAVIKEIVDDGIAHVCIGVLHKRNF